MGEVDIPRPNAVPFTAILLAFKDQTAAIDISAAVSVQDVTEIILIVFHLKASTRIILKRASDGAIVVPGPTIAPGEYTVEEIESKLLITSPSCRRLFVIHALQNKTHDRSTCRGKTYQCHLLKLSIGRLLHI